MRADRLLSILMLLQTHRRMTARQLAAQLEVSPRTIYRDLVALSAAGIPLYTEDGCNGGITLIEEYRTDLTGLNADEVRALSMLHIPEPLVKLGVGQELKAALLKLTAALPAASQSLAAQAGQRIYLDAAPWFQPEETAPHLSTLYQAVWQERKLRLVYRSNFDALIEQVVAPYGLVAKANTWYLVGEFNGRLRALRSSRIQEAAILEESAARPADFNLAAFWKTWCEEFEQNRPSYAVTARISPALAKLLPRSFGERAADILAQAGPPDEAGWRTVTLQFEHFEAARSHILSLGCDIEVIDPLPLRLSVIDFAHQIFEFYTKSDLIRFDP